MVKGPGVEGEGRGDLGVRFDKLNELRGAHSDAGVSSERRGDAGFGTSYPPDKGGTGGLSPVGSASV